MFICEAEAMIVTSTHHDKAREKYIKIFCKTPTIQLKAKIHLFAERTAGSRFVIRRTYKKISSLIQTIFFKANEMVHYHARSFGTQFQETCNGI